MIMNGSDLSNGLIMGLEVSISLSVSNIVCYVYVH